MRYLPTLATLLTLTACGPDKPADPDADTTDTGVAEETAVAEDTKVPEDTSTDDTTATDTGDPRDTTPDDTSTPDDTGGAPDTSAALEIESVVPKSGSVQGGTQISVIGTGFQPGAKLIVGPRETEFTTVISSQKINGKTTGAPSPGLYDVTVEQNGQSDTMRKIFEYK